MDLRKIYFQEENEQICNTIGAPLPEQEILQASAKFIHKLMSQNEKTSVHDYIERQSCSTT